MILMTKRLSEFINQNKSPALLYIVIKDCTLVLFQFLSTIFIIPHEHYTSTTYTHRFTQRKTYKDCNT